MNSHPRPAPSDEELDRLLARRYRDTSPEFEARWVALKRELRQAPPAHARLLPAWRLTGWLGALGAAAAVAFVVYSTRPPVSSPAAPDLSPQLTELLAMDAVLGRALPLLDEENRTALLHLPAAGQSKPETP
ncbi:MAG: hypothetical protein HYV75_00305 [Opitutae bacterium]|nr:hypothetical protein [Opitutae bacterium]